MSLKSVHITIIICSILLAFGFGQWSLADFNSGGPRINAALGILSWLTGTVLIFYVVWFWKKSRRENL